MNDYQIEMIHSWDNSRIDSQILRCVDLFKNNPEYQVGYVNEYYQILLLVRASRIGVK